MSGALELLATLFGAFEIVRNRLAHLKLCETAPKALFRQTAQLNLHQMVWQSNPNVNLSQSTPEHMEAAFGSTGVERERKQASSESMNTHQMAQFNLYQKR